MSERNVWGVDPSLTSTGLARIGEDNVPELITVRSSGTRADSYGTRHARIKRLSTEIAAFIKPDDTLVIIEGPALRSTDPGVWDRAGLWWLLYTRIVGLGVPVGVCPPKTRAKFATGNGNADKKAVRAGIQELWPDVLIRNSDTADALTMCTMAAQIVGMNVPRLDRHALSLPMVALEVSA